MTDLKAIRERWKVKPVIDCDLCDSTERERAVNIPADGEKDVKALLDHVDELDDTAVILERRLGESEEEVAELEAQVKELAGVIVGGIVKDHRIEGVLEYCPFCETDLVAQADRYDPDYYPEVRSGHAPDCPVLKARELK